MSGGVRGLGRRRAAGFGPAVLALIGCMGSIVGVVRDFEPYPFTGQFECWLPWCLYSNGWVALFDGSDESKQGLDDDWVEFNLDPLGPLDRSALDEVCERVERHIASCGPRPWGNSGDVDRPRYGTVLYLTSSDRNRSAAAWLAQRVRVQGAPWGQALEHARMVGLDGGSEVEALVRDYVRGPEPERFAGVKAQVRARFPAVQQMSVAALAARMEMSRQPPVLLDVRAKDEFGTSHLVGARHAQDLEAALAALGGLPKHTDIVTYCSVGWRSSDLAQRLTSRGYTRVRNLEGSLFEWANRGHAVHRGPERVHAVHPFDTDWGALLHRDFWPQGFGE